MSVVTVGEREDIESAAAGLGSRLGSGSLQADLNDGGRRILLDQANDPTARLEIISQGPTHAAGRVFFSLCSADGRPYGTGTLDIIVYANRVHFIPSVFVDELNRAAIERSGLVVGLPGVTGSVEVQGRPVAVNSDSGSSGFGDPASPFDIAFEQTGGRAVKLGWLRNQYPPFIYLREVAADPRKDDL